MKKTFFRMITMVILNVLLLSIGMTAFAATKTTVMPRWTYLVGTAYLFEKSETYDEYDIIACGGDTSTPLNVNAYVSVELQYLVNGSWQRVAFWDEYGNMSATVEEYVRVRPGYTYRLLLTHQAYDTNGNLLETFNDQPDYYVVSLPRP